jgi:hypothetical protein
MTNPQVELEQLEARTRDLLAALGLEKTGSMTLDREWLKQITGAELWSFLLVGAVGSTQGGHLWAIVAQPTPDGELVAAHLVDVRKRETPA